MTDIKIDAVGVTSRDIVASVAFYRLLGFGFGPVADGDQHVEASTAPGAVRLMIDSHALAAELLGEPPRPSNHAHFALLCASPAEVDHVAKAVAAAGHQIISPPWDAFWGQRYAVVSDPDGYRIDLFAPL